MDSHYPMTGIRKPIAEIRTSRNAISREEWINAYVSIELQKLIAQGKAGDTLEVLNNIGDRECDILEDITIKMQKGALEMADFATIGAMFVDMVHGYHKARLENEAEAECTILDDE